MEINDKNYISLNNVSKFYGKAQVLKNVTVSFEKGKIHGIIGRNGSGKTQLFKCICGFVEIDIGSVFVDGKRIRKDIDVPENIGIILEAPGFLSGYSGYRNLEMLYCIKNGKSKKGREHIKKVMEMVGLEPNERKGVEKYSMGMRQRLGIAQSFMEGQELLILDEPMNGLDNQGVEDMRKLFLELKEQGKTILLASHNREDIEVLCDEVYEMDAGVLVKKLQN